MQKVVVRNRFAIGDRLPTELRNGINQVFWTLTDAWPQRTGYLRAPTNPEQGNILPGPSGASTRGGSHAIHPGTGAGVGAFTWEQARREGLTSSLFDVDLHNAGDTRAGLEGDGARQVEALMRAQGLTFDQARLALHRERLQANDVDPFTGMPLDSKAVLSLPAKRP